jgi:hypothetical protein
VRSKNIQRDGSGNSAESDYINRVLGRLEELQFYDSQTVKVEQTMRGTRFHVKKTFGVPGVAGWHFESKIEADQTQSYPTQSVIHVQSSSALATTGIRDLANPTGPLVLSKPGYYVARQAVPAKTTVSGNDVWNIPQWPEPNGANKDDPLNFWLYFGEIYC